MRKSFYDAFLRQDAWLLYDDVGYGVIDVSHPRCVNVGIAEQTMVGMACGMASEGAKVYCYAIAPHFIRAWEFVRNLVVYKRRDVTLVGVGVNGDYAALGHTHAITTSEMRSLCDAVCLPYYCPRDLADLIVAMAAPGPKFLHLRKGGV
jgi:transketolase